ncbi:hypothetical protein BMJ32_14140 [Sinorhizobium medicae]|nr:hypothetical protein BMJ32_14140 [Sinorhizobium medicae]
MFNLRSYAIAELLWSRAATSAASGIEGWAPGLRQASEPATAARRRASAKSRPASRPAAS